MLEVAKVGLVLRDQLSQETEHIAFDVRVGILVYRQAAGRVLSE